MLGRRGKRLGSRWGVGSGYIGCKNEIILHVGHKNVQDYYLEKRL